MNPAGRNRSRGETEKARGALPEQGTLQDRETFTQGLTWSPGVPLKRRIWAGEKTGLDASLLLLFFEMGRVEGTVAAGMVPRPFRKNQNADKRRNTETIPSGNSLTEVGQRE